MVRLPGVSLSGSEYGGVLRRRQVRDEATCSSMGGSSGESRDESESKEGTDDF